MAAPTVRTVRQAAALAALANPHRARLLDALRVDGPSTTSGLARRTEQAVGSVSHHLKVLAESGFVEEVPERARDRRERWWQLPHQGVRWNRADLHDAEASDAALEAELLHAERMADRTRAWLSERDVDEQWLRAAYASQHWMRLTASELNELHDELQEVLNRWSQRVAEEREERAANPDARPIVVISRAFPSEP